MLKNSTYLHRTIALSIACVGIENTETHVQKTQTKCTVNRVEATLASLHRWALGQGQKLESQCH